MIPNLDPFKKINWKNLYDANENTYLTDCSIKKKMVKLFGVTYVVECKTNRGVKDEVDELYQKLEDVVGRIKTGDLQITRFAYADGYKDDLINDIQGKREIENALLDNKKLIGIFGLQVNVK